MDQQSQEEFSDSPIYIDYAKDSYFDFNFFKINVFTTQIIDTIERIPTNRPHFSLVHSRDNFDYLQLEILGSFMVLAKSSFGTSLAIKVTIPRSQLVLQQFSGYLKELKCIYVMKDGLLSDMFKYSEASVIYNPESHEYQLLCNEDFGDYEYHVLIAAPKYKEDDYFVNFQHYVPVHGSHYQFSYGSSVERKPLFQDVLDVIFNRNTMSSGKFIVDYIDVALLSDYQKPNEIKELSLLGSYQLDASLVNIYSDMLADHEIQLEYYQNTPLLNLHPNSVKIMKINSEKRSFETLPYNSISPDSFWNTTLSIKDVKKFSLAVFGSLDSSATLGVEYPINFNRDFKYSLENNQELTFTISSFSPGKPVHANFKVTRVERAPEIDKSYTVLHHFVVDQVLTSLKLDSIQFSFASQDLYKDNTLIDKSSLQCVFIPRTGEPIFAKPLIGGNHLYCEHDSTDSSYEMVIVGKAEKDSKDSTGTGVLIFLLVVSIYGSLLMIALLSALCFYIRKRKHYSAYPDEGLQLGTINTVKY